MSANLSVSLSSTVLTGQCHFNHADRMVFSYAYRAAENLKVQRMHMHTLLEEELVASEELKALREGRKLFTSQRVHVEVVQVYLGGFG